MNNILRRLIIMCARLVLKLLYRVEVKGLDHLRETGAPAMIVANHVSRLDRLLILAFIGDDMAFAVAAKTAPSRKDKFTNWLFNETAIDTSNAMANRKLVQDLKAGGRMVFFPEGRITTTGSLMKFHDAPAAIAHLAQSPIVPIYIDGAQYSKWSKMHGIQKLHFLPKITLTILPSVTLSPQQDIAGADLRDYLSHKFSDLMTGMAFDASNLDRTLLQGVIDAKNRHGAKYIILEDIQRTPMSYGRLLTGIFVLGREINRLTRHQNNVGVLLPNSAGFLVTILALHAYNRTPALLNYSTGGMNMVAACKAAEISTIFTSRKFIELGGFHDEIDLLSKQARIIYLEDVREKISALAKIVGLIKSKFPCLALKTHNQTTSSSAPAVILFTSGSEGVPKGVVLSHRNIQANIQQIISRIPVNGGDVVFNALPMFHAFGLSLGTFLPIQTGIKLFLYPSPLHYKAIPELCYDVNATLLLGTDTFLTGYARSAHPYDFYTLRFAVAGAERLKPETRKLWMDKFGLRVVEGYGATECAPVIAANTPFHYKPGTVGRIFDGMNWRLEPVEGIKDGGKLIIKGPNVMSGYLRADNPGVIEPPANGWYDTGDIVDIDKQGYVTILGRAKRFSKISGEMVSLGAVEGVIEQAYPEVEQTVVAVPDRKKGEKLVLVTTDESIDAKSLAAALKEQKLPPLMVPKTILHIEELPLLGSGKIDHVTINRLAREKIPE